MSAQIIRTIVFTQIIAFNSYLDNLGKPLNSTLNSQAFFQYEHVKSECDILPHFFPIIVSPVSQNLF